MAVLDLQVVEDAPGGRQEPSLPPGDRGRVHRRDLHKLIYHFDLVIYLYALNALMVSIDIILYLRNRVYHTRESLAAAVREGKGDAK